MTTRTMGEMVSSECTGESTDRKEQAQGVLFLFQVTENKRAFMAVLKESHISCSCRLASLKKIDAYFNCAHCRITL